MPGQKVMTQWSRRRYAGAPMVVCDMQDLVWLMNMAKPPYGEVGKDDNGHGHAPKPAHLAKVEIHHADKIDEHALAVGRALKCAITGLENANQYATTFVGMLKKPGTEPVNCRHFMNSWWQSRLWVAEAFKEFAELHAAIARLQGHVTFVHQCEEDPCAEPVVYGNKGGQARKRQSQQTHAVQAK